ncbi:MAG: tRNA-dihydrouridine synthase family protein [Bacteroidales bacterium]
MKIVPQLMGNIPSHFVDTMNALYRQYGYTHFNWNMGCPVSQIVRKQRGCGLMPYPDKVEEVVKKVTSQTGFYLSVKMRLGLHDFSEGIEMINRLNRYPLEFIVIHPRLGDWQYEGISNLEMFEQMSTISIHEIMYSGDINTLSDFKILQQRFPFVQQWMLGRGILKNPFLAEQMINDKAADLASYRKRFINFYHDLVLALLETRNEKGVLANLKELWHYFAFFFQVEETTLLNLFRINELNDFQQTVEMIMWHDSN